MLQAAASGVLLPLVSVVPMLVFPVEKRGTAMGVAGIVMSAGPAVGPVLGGAIIDAYGWRVTLGCIVPLALAVLLCGVFLLENVGEAKRPKLDVASIALSTIAFGGLLYGFSSASTLGWTSIAVLGTIIAGIVCLIAFVKRQRTLEEPLLDLRCLKSSDFAVAAIVVTLINAACLVTNTLLPHSAPNGHGRIGARNGHCHAARSCSRHSHQPYLRHRIRQVRPALDFRGRPRAYDRSALRPVSA